MPKIIWCGNKSWDTDFPENTLPNNAKRIERPDNIFIGKFRLLISIRQRKTLSLSMINKIMIC